LLAFRFSSVDLIYQIYFFIKGSFNILHSFFVCHAFSSLCLQSFGELSDSVFSFVRIVFENCLYFFDFLLICHTFSSFLIYLLLQKKELIFIESTFSCEFIDQSRHLLLFLIHLGLHLSDILLVVLFFLFVHLE